MLSQQTAILGILPPGNRYRDACWVDKVPDGKRPAYPTSPSFAAVWKSQQFNDFPARFSN